MQQSVTMSVRSMLVLSQLIAGCLSQYIGAMGSATAVGMSGDGIGPSAGCSGGIGTVPPQLLFPPYCYYPHWPRYDSGYRCGSGSVGGHGYESGNGGAYGYAAAYGGAYDQIPAYGGAYGQPLSYGGVYGQGYAAATSGMSYGSGMGILNGDNYGGYGSSAPPYQYTPLSAPVIAAPVVPAVPVIPKAPGTRSPQKQVSSNENTNTNINVNNQFGKHRYSGRELLATPQ